MADLRGYGASSKPPGDADHANYSRRTMARDMRRLMQALGHDRFDVQALAVRSAGVEAPFTLSARHQRMVLEGLDVIGLSLTYQPQIEAFAAAHWVRHPWLRDVSAVTAARLQASTR